jgi:predicted ATPase/class 3 adenylate cyclase/Tfp pilus assembly protein PilF
MGNAVQGAPTGEVVIVFSDVQDSTVLWDRAPEAMHTALELHDKLLREVIEDFGCYEVKAKGDAFMIAARDVTRALQMCFEAQRRLLECPWPGDVLDQPSGAELKSESGTLVFRGLRVRMGIHLGRPRCKPDPTTGRMDYFGGMVNRAARVADAAHGGQVLLSDAAFAQLEPELEIKVADLGVHRLRGLRREEHLRQVQPIGHTARRFPPARTFGIRHATLPKGRSEFFGREDALLELRTKLHLDTSALVILAPTGMGKTRFALRFAELYGDEFDGGVWFCDLAAAQTLEGLLREVARCLGLALSGAAVWRQIEQIGHALAGREEALFLFDNVEQVSRSMGEALEKWIPRAPEARFLITSQRPIAGDDILEYDLPQLGPVAAVELFIRRAQLVDAGFSVDERGRKSVERLVERLRFIPLAIAIAAARVDMLSLSKLEKRLGSRFEALVQPPDLVEQQQVTLHQLGDWSWELLAPWARSALQQCAAFVGGFSLIEARALVDLSAFPDAPTMAKALETLCNQSLLYQVISPEASSVQRYGLYGVVRSQAEQALQDSGQVDDVMQRHAQVYLELAEGLELLVSGPDGLAAVNCLAAELNNLLAVHRRFEELNPLWAARAAISLMPLLIYRGPILLAVDLLENGAAARERLPAEQRLKGLQWRCEVRRLVGRPADAMIDGEEMLRLAKALGDEGATANAWSRLAIVDSDLGDRMKAERRLDRAFQIAKKIDDTALLARILNNLAVFRIEKGEPLQAEIYQRRSLELLRKVGDHQRESSIWCNLGTLCMDRGDLHEADENYGRALQLALGLGHTEAQAMVLSNMGTLYWRLGQRDQAEGLYTRALVLLRESGSRRTEGFVLALLGGLTGDKGMTERARQRLRHAREILAELRDPLGQALVDLAYAFIDLAQVRQAHSEGDLVSAKKAKSVADKRLREVRKPLADGDGGSASAADLCDDIRSLLTLLERSFAELPRLKPGVLGGAAAQRRLVPWEEELFDEDTSVDGESLSDDFEG